MALEPNKEPDEMIRTKYEYDAAQDETGVWRVRHLHGHGRKGFSYTSKHASEAEARAEAIAVKAMTDRQIFEARARHVTQRAMRKDAQG
jgi:hypothetical protein